MSNPLWQKFDTTVDARIMRFLAADDVVLDREFFLHDIAASKAHVDGLARIGVLSEGESKSLQEQLSILADLFTAGGFVLDDNFEDGHSAIEDFLTQKIGDAGRKVHTGRSRNDQILVATRLWMKEKLASLLASCRAIAEICLQRAGVESIVMPGYTHLQRAVVSTTSMWFAGFAEAFIDNAIRAKQTAAWIDTNPLGTAAGYGVNLKLDRDGTTEALSFSRLQISPVYAQLSRGKFEIAALDTVGAALLDVRRLAWDLSLFTTSEYGFVDLPEEFTTGSSIMPNKRNPDVIELMRATYATCAAARTEIEQLLSLPSGYQRDVQFSKGPLVRGFSRGLAAIELLPDLLTRLVWREDRMRAAIEPAMYATDVAIEQAVKGVPFREAYRRAAEVDDAQREGRTPEASAAARVSPGGAADLRLNDLRSRLAAV